MRERVASRYVQAGADDTIDRWSDLFLDALGQKVDFSEKDITRLFQINGISAEDLNKLDTGKQAGEEIYTLGGWIRRGLWYVLVRPFVVLGKFVKSQEFRTEVKTAIRKAVRQEVRSTRHMVRVLDRLSRGEDVHPQELKAALRQFADLASKVVLLIILGPNVANLFTAGAWKAMSAILAPLSEILVVLFHRPIQAAAKLFLSTPV
jgi:uncharacterized protein YnzC (UPF0291/DUF896 family)